MSSSGPNLTRFIRRVYRRLLLLRLLEGAGLGLLATSLAGLLLLPALMYRGQPGLAAAGALLLLGAVGGLVGAWLRRPRVLEAALEADRQLDLADLLSTAWTLSPARDGAEWAGAVLVVAEARCATLSPATVLLNRWGARGWGAIGLGAALVLALGLISSNPLDTRASTAQRPAAAAGQRLAIRLPAAPERAMSGTSRPGVGPVSDFPNQNENGFDPSRKTTTVSKSAPGPGQSVENANPDGAGPGAGASRATGSNDPLGISGTAASRTGAEGTAAGGAGTSSTDGHGTAGASGTAAGTERGQTAPPWSSANWPAAQQAASAALRSERIPPRYHELIRAYFDREE